MFGENDSEALNGLFGYALMKHMSFIFIQNLQETYARIRKRIR